MHVRQLLAALVVLAGAVGIGEAVIMAPLELRKILGDSQYVVVAKVEQLFPEKPAMVLTVADDLKGKSTLRRLPINLKGDKEAEKLNHVPQLLARLGTELPLVVFITPEKAKQRYAFAFTNGTWFQMVGQRSGDNMVWSLSHGEPYLRRTFKGTTDELRHTVADVLAGKKKAPPVNAKEEPGFGPELEKK